MELVLLISFAILAILGDLLLIYQMIEEEKNLHIKPKGNYSPSVSIIVPKKGLDPNFCKNLESLMNQDFKGNYEVIYVIDGDVEDCLLKESRVKIINVESMCTECSGKINAQLTGLKYAKGEVIVFADSDTWYPPYWLREGVESLTVYDAVSTFSWPKPVRYTLSNLIRAGFWTLGFESQFSQGSRFLWGGSMFLRREFFTNDVIDELSREWCDDCTITRILKRKGMSIGFSKDIIPLNYYDEKELINWSKREAMAVRKYSGRGAKYFLVAGIVLIALLIYSILTLNLITFTPFILWFVKNLLRGRKYGAYSLIPALMSVLGIFYAYFILVINWRSKNVIWRGRVYDLTNYHSET